MLRNIGKLLERDEPAKLVHQRTAEYAQFMVAHVHGTLTAIELRLQDDGSWNLHTTTKGDAAFK